MTFGLSILFTVMMVADKLPATSNDLPLLGKFYVGLIFITFIATVCTTLVLNVQMKGNHHEPVPGWFKRMVKKYRFMQIIFERYWTQKRRSICKGDPLLPQRNGTSAVNNNYGNGNDNTKYNNNNDHIKVRLFLFLEGVFVVLAFCFNRNSGFLPKLFYYFFAKRIFPQFQKFFII